MKNQEIPLEHIVKIGDIAQTKYALFLECISSFKARGIVKTSVNQIHDSWCFEIDPEEFNLVTKELKQFGINLEPEEEKAESRSKFGLLNYLSPSSFLKGLFIMIFGLLLITGGQFGIQVADKDPNWIPIPKLEQTWIAWFIVWLGFDSIFNNRISHFIFNKVIAPILNPILQPIKNHPRVKQLISRLNKAKSRR